MKTFERLLAQQNSPAEVLVFLALSVALFLVIALLLYVILITMLRPGLSKQIPLRRVLLPSGEQLRINLGDYALVLATSLLLSLTLLAKQDLVEQIANYEMNSLDKKQIDALFDVAPPPELASRLAHETLEEIVQPILKAGRVEEVSILVKSVVLLIKQDDPQWLTATKLVVASCLLASLYLAWLAWRRFRTLRERPDSAPDYSSTFRSLLTLGLCVGLLLASALPLAEGHEHLLGNSALAAIAHESGPPENSAIRDAITTEMATQRWIVQNFIDRTKKVEKRTLETAAELAVEFDNHVRSSQRSEAMLHDELASLQSTVTILREQILQLNVDRKELGDRVAALESEGSRSEGRLAKLETSTSTGARELERLKAQNVRWGARLSALELSSAEQAKRFVAVEKVANGAAECCQTRERKIEQLTQRQREHHDRIAEEGRARRDALRDLETELSEIQRRLEDPRCCTVD